MPELNFPPAGSELSERLDADYVKFCATRERSRLPTLREAKLGWPRRMTDPAMRRIEGLVLLADDTLALVSVGKRGGHKVEWRFGKLT